ncbi:MAG: hypothetical protein A3F10_03215 [Coxiella sp. RIFCSPHIGHO2_12_FULL_42_15]|nr:MAG: hypothetical protein A3F10_03215 [Coxiella sp. RIFCSPHIGHO2_12_FULL_42_15]
MHHHPPEEFDLIIVGFGLVGSSFVLALQQQGLKIAVIEKHVPEVATDAAVSFRPISLAYGSVAIFRTLGMWHGLQNKATPIKEVIVCEEGSLGAVHFTAAEIALEALGFVVPFADLYRHLYRGAVGQTGVEIIPIQKTTHIERVENQTHVFVETAQGARELRAALVVGCDGAQSSVRHLLNIPTIEKQSADAAVTGMLTLAEPYSPIALERFTKEGVVAILPLADPKQCGVVMTLPQAVIESRQSWTETEWLVALAPHLAQRIPRILSFEKGGVFPLQTIIAKKQLLPGVILLGNAAHTIYPLAAQGFNLGLRDAAALAEILVQARQELQPLGQEHLLQRYVAWREQDQKRTAQLTMVIAHLFKMQFPGASLLRGLSLLSLDLLTPMKKRLARMTMGLSGSLPKLMRGLPLWEMTQHHD